MASSDIYSHDLLRESANRSSNQIKSSSRESIREAISMAIKEGKPSSVILQLSEILNKLESHEN